MAAENKDNRGEIVLYQTKNRRAKLEVRLEGETVWLSQNQMAILFDQTKQNISLHVRNLFKERELQKRSVVKEYLTTAADGKQYNVSYYNLDVIISVGYRVRSARGTQFRIWATQVLREHLIKGYTLNEKRLRKKVENYKELKDALGLIGHVIERQALDSDQAGGLLRVITDFAYALDILDAYDSQRLEITGVSRRKSKSIRYPEARRIIETLRTQYQATGLFGREKDDSLKSSLSTIFQTFDGRPLYPSMEEKAANLLYFLVKNHHFTDGNKRIAAFLFLWFLEKNKALYRKDGSKRIADNTLVAITLMIAESNPKHKEIIVKVLINLINEKN